MCGKEYQLHIFSCIIFTIVIETCELFCKHAKGSITLSVYYCILINRVYGYRSSICYCKQTQTDENVINWSKLSRIITWAAQLPALLNYIKYYHNTGGFLISSKCWCVPISSLLSFEDQHQHYLTCGLFRNPVILVTFIHLSIIIDFQIKSLGH